MEEYHVLIQLFKEALGGIELPACISMVNINGLPLFQIGEETSFLLWFSKEFITDIEDHGILFDDYYYAGITSAFDEARKRVLMLHQTLGQLLLTTEEGCSVYVNDLERSGFFIIVSAQPEIMHKILPFLDNVIKKTKILMKEEALMRTKETNEPWEGWEKELNRVKQKKRPRKNG